MRQPKYEHIYDYRPEELLPVPDRESFEGDELAAYDWVMERLRAMHESVPALRDSEKGFSIPPLCTGLLQSPEIAKRWMSFSGWFQGNEARGSYSNRERELIEQSLNTLTGKRSGIRVADAVGNGVSPLVIKAIWEGRLDDLEPEDRQLVEYVHATYRGELTPELFGALEARMGRKGAIEYTSQIWFKVGLMSTVKAMWNLQGQHSDPASGEDLLQGYLDGEYEPNPAGRTGIWVEPSRAAAT